MLAFVFPGQGSQKVGMGESLAEAFPEAREIFDRAEEILGFSLRKLCFEGPEEQLQQTAITQPALLTVSVATLRVLERQTGVRPAVVAGHSLGEYSALVCAKALRFEDALHLVRLRGEFMQQAAPPGEGAMAAVLGLDRAVVEQICREAADGRVVSPANYNSPSQIVVAGHADAVQRVAKLAESLGGKAVTLNVSAPFHCSLMAPAAAQLAEALHKVVFARPETPVISNVTARPYELTDSIADSLVQQVTSPVRWADSVQTMKALGVTEVLEVGPGEVLSRLIKQSESEMSSQGIETVEKVNELKWEPDREKRLVDEGWVRKGNRLVSPDQMRIVFDCGLEWDATHPGAFGF